MAKALGSLLEINETKLQIVKIYTKPKPPITEFKPESLLKQYCTYKLMGNH